MIAAFAAVFALALVLASLFTPLFSSFIRNSALGGIDQGWASFSAWCAGILLVAVALLVFDRAVPPGSVEMVENSRSAAVFSQLSGNLNTAVPTDAPNWLVARYEHLTAGCRQPG